jgi:hypothetical protein
VFTSHFGSPVVDIAPTRIFVSGLRDRGHDFFGLQEDGPGAGPYNSSNDLSVKDLLIPSLCTIYLPCRLDMKKDQITNL